MAYAVIEGMTGEAANSFEGARQMGVQNIQALSAQRERVVSRLTIAQRIKPYVEDGCAKGPAYKRESLFGKKVLDRCKADIPQDLLNEQQDTERAVALSIYIRPLFR